MDLNKNYIPDHLKSIHLIAACGTGMGALACMLKDAGFAITGSDRKVYPPISTFLSARGINLSDGFSPENLSYGPDLVIVGNAVRRENSEAVKMMEMGIPFCSMPQAVRNIFAKKKKTILITGTHGKTTTASIIAWIFHEAGRYESKWDPSFIIGGILKNFGSNYRVGKGEYIVIEGDEYDTAFFDKGAKFLHYDPLMTILTSVEFDHADIFKDLDHVKRTFKTFLDAISSKSSLFVFDNDANIDTLVVNGKFRLEKYGKKESSGWRLADIEIDPPWTKFRLLKHGGKATTFKTRLMGEHNLLNASAAIAIAHSLHIPLEIIQKAVATFQGIKRRQEVRGLKNNITVMDDFAHHPTAVRETIKAVKPYYPDGRVIAVFEPRTNSSMRKVFQDVYPLSFDFADIICIRKPPLLNKIPSDDRFSSKKLVEDIKSRNKDAYYFKNTEEIIAFLIKEAKPKDLILIMSNGGFDNIHERLLDGGL
ncbi:UDP-N-acetylmuramate: L-alanyl-gamma-D-glutamyl-meso-diaminopimelate ligase [Desulfosarcina sp. BuS5]|uniref:UDP-N-acetylmuramate--L-alanine ligase n=1 Tax=Desulfosarcina sp. BuS5 TaxID=933262 RepID=UPI00048280C2|nr:Mur ligase family protein [Desulfosarcina sp. BuS5]WDN89806.1 UDP-N-acetylmuramate: L-alanyl-gamma-D-glutamyl-meso-diaminopimelate ligase [Desulfosarcina sp. BuS5]